MGAFEQILEKYRADARSQRDKGDKFERLMQRFLRTAPEYCNSFRHVWLWADFPYKKSFGSGRDTGIDIVCQNLSGEFWAVQCKCYSETTQIDKPDVDSFLATSSKYIVLEDGSQVKFANRLWISTTNNWGSEAENTIQFQTPPVSRLNLKDLEEAPVDWTILDSGLSGMQARREPKSPRKHQVDAIEATHEYFKTHDRGKLIMACGTGKTFTALKIAEREVGAGGLVLFLAPSIALVGQTLREWMAESAIPIYPICVCSDPKASRARIKNDEDGYESLVDLALPATTNVEDIKNRLKWWKKSLQDHMLVIFSTYQSIDAVSEAKEAFNLVVCDEAHRTTGVTLANKDETAFVRVHKNEFINASKRLYMTATPRLYADTAKKKASDVGATLCSMDDPTHYGEEIYRLGFGEAVDRGLLAEYKVLVLTVSDASLGENMQAVVENKDKKISIEAAAKLIGCINALSKRFSNDNKIVKKSDPWFMRRAVAFCRSIAASKEDAELFNDFKSCFYEDLKPEDRKKVVDVTAKHVDGTMSVPKRDGLLSWLKSVPDSDNDCRILTNVRCLSEGVDVPSLDAAIFLSAKNSQIDVVQSVGRVMRMAPGKKFGYIIIPILVPSDMKPEDALDDNKRFQVVWTVLNALRAHDDRFDAMINKLEVNGGSGDTVVVDPGDGDGGNGGDGDEGDGGNGGNGDDGDNDKKKVRRLLPLPFQELQNAVYARMVLKVGNRRYLQQWAEDVAKIAKLYISRIGRLVGQEGPHKTTFEQMLAWLKNDLNPAVDEQRLIEMLAQHMITKPVFEALFGNQTFVRHNPVSKALQAMVELLESQAFEKDTVTLSRFYDSIQYRVKGIQNPHERQKVILELYDKFFRLAFDDDTDRYGIVYTPVEIVDFINQSVAELLQATFGRSLSDENVHVLDPFTGTGTFIARMLETGLIDQDALQRKYNHELHANEIMLLAYYIASVNIENAYHSVREVQNSYEAFPGICLTDTFQQGEGYATSDFARDKELREEFDRVDETNTDRVKKQRIAPIQVIVGNPPYRAGQDNANDNAQNQSYPVLENRIASTYLTGSKASTKKALFDSYIKAFRWASDRIDKEAGGIIAFVTNAGWLDGNAMDGMRKCLEEEFSAIYVFNLRGNCRTQGELRKREAGNVFGLGSRTPIAITVLLKNPSHEGKALIQYHDIGDYLTREQKLEIVASKRSVLEPGFGWVRLTPDKNGDWLNQRSAHFESFIPLGDKGDKAQNSIFKSIYSLGLNTNCDQWCYNYSKLLLSKNIKLYEETFNNETNKYYKTDKCISFEKFCTKDETKIKWHSSLFPKAKNHTLLKFNENLIKNSLYRPFCKQYCYFDRNFVQRISKLYDIFQPLLSKTSLCNNIVICVSAFKPGNPIISKFVPDLHLNGDSQCFPLYYYEPKKDYRTQLPGIEQTEDAYERKDGITQFAEFQYRQRYGQNVTKEDIFYFVYGFLHSPDYRTTFANDLKKSLPRIPFLDRADDFWAFSKAGRELADLHLNYEEQPACSDVKVEIQDKDGLDETSLCRVVKMRFPDKADKSVIRYNEHITLSNIPLEAYDYVVNGRSAIEWIMERYQVKTDSASGIVNDPNDWSAEHDKPRYILDLLLSVITVSLKTQAIVNGLPKLTFGGE